MGKPTYPITLYGLSSDLKIIKEGNIIVKISEDFNTLSFDKLGIYPADDTGAWDVILPGMVLTK